VRYRREVVITVSPEWLFLAEKWCLEWLERWGFIGAGWRAWPIHWPYELAIRNGPIVCEGE
jgi:hypothetical protein